MLKVYLIQMESKPKCKESNFRRAQALIEGAAPTKGSLILLPEMFATGYIPQDSTDLAENLDQIDSPTNIFLKKLAQDYKCCVVGGGMHHNGNAITNRTNVFFPEGNSFAESYEKLNLFFPEQGTLTPGTKNTIFKVNDFTISPFICFDLRFPEVFRQSVKMETELVSVQAAWPAKRNEHWETLLKARAIENQIYVAAVNAVSSDGIYCGNSQIISPTGEVLVKAESGKECVVSAELDVESLHTYRQKFPVVSNIL